jgi:TonB-linked SusC/RagA family outer membrane protein
MKYFKYLLVFIFFVSVNTAFGQGFTIQGTVTDDAGETLPGASVIVRGTGVGTTTDAGGQFTLNNVTADAVLQISFVGFGTQNITVGTQRVFNVQLDASTEFEEIVVIGYGTQSRASVTSSIVSVTTEDILKSPTASLGNALQGRLPGFSAQQFSGLPGHDDPEIFIRGIGSLSAGRSSPLILVDGVERSFTQIDPNEVADISILKDAGATAVFGVRGANGVILVTTRRGQSGRATVSVSGGISYQQPMNHVTFAESYMYATTYNQMQIGDGTTPMFNSDAINNWRLKENPVLYPSIDWKSYIMKNHSMQNQFNINVSGGNDDVRYFVSVGRLNQGGMFETFTSDPRMNFNYTRYNYRANLDINLSKTTTVMVNLGGRVEERTGLSSRPGADDGGNREARIFRYLAEATPMSGAGIVDGKWVLNNPTVFGDTRNQRNDGLWPFYAQGFTDDANNVINFDLQLKQKLDVLIPGLEASFKGAYNNDFSHEKLREGWFTVPRYRPFPVRDNDGKIVDYTLEKAQEAASLGYSESMSYGRNWYFETSLFWQRRFNVHNVSALALYNQTKHYYRWDGYRDIPRGYVGVVGRVTYDYKFKYLADFSVGFNGSENFAQGRRFGLFPAGSVGWIPTEEEFMQGQNIVQYLKLRYSYGIVGNDSGVGRFIYLPDTYVHGTPVRAWDSDANRPYDGLPGYPFGLTRGRYTPNVREGNMGNPIVSWEKARKQNIGLDMRTLNNRLSVNLDYFMEYRWDILINPDANIPGFWALPNTPPGNLGIVENHGYEIQLSWSDRIGSDFSYTISPNMSYSRNKIIDQLEIARMYDFQVRTGKRVGQPFGYEFFGLYEAGVTEGLYRAKYGRELPDHNYVLRDGDAVFVDLTESGSITGEDQHAIGNPNQPAYNFGLNINLRYKRFDMSMLWIGAAQVSRSLTGPFVNPFGQNNDAALLTYRAENSWTPDNKNALFPRITETNMGNNSRYSSIYLVDASFARLKNVEVGYNFNVDNISFMSSARLYLTGNNLLTFTNYKANDPEPITANYGFFRYPTLRTFTVGFRANF